VVQATPPAQLRQAAAAWGTCATLARSQHTHARHFANPPGAFQSVVAVAKMARLSVMAATKVCWPDGSLQASLPAQHATESP